jgi:hypothetical protein
MFLITQNIFSDFLTISSLEEFNNSNASSVNTQSSSTIDKAVSYSLLRLYIESNFIISAIQI